MDVNWRTVSRDPNDRGVRRLLLEQLRAAHRGPVDKLELFQEFVRGHRTLDIGVVAHEIERTSAENWKHELIRTSASYTLGIDILEDAVEALRERGYNVRVADATSELDLGERFERVVIGDVIEHVDNPVALLRFASRHLAPEGRILVSTPNPFFLRTILENVRAGTFVANAEHVCWITPSMALELAARAGLRLDGYWQTRGRGKTPLRRLAVLALGALGQRDSELFSTSFCYVFAPNPES